MTNAKGVLRSLWASRSPMLGLTLGLATASAVAIVVWAVVARVLYQPLPYASPERLIVAWDAAGPAETLTNGQFQAWTSQSRTTAAMAAYAPTDALLDSNGQGARVTGAIVSSELFGVLGVPAWLGRTLTPPDGAAVSVPPIVVSYSCWRHDLGGDPDILERSIRLDGRPYRVVGVMPEGFFFPSREDAYWVPIVDDLSGRRSWRYPVVARLAQNATEEQARQEAQAAVARVDASDSSSTIVVESLRAHTVKQVRPILLALEALAAAMVLIAIANAGALLWVRGVTLTRQEAIEQALGASLARIVRRRIWELSFIGLAAAALSVAIAEIALRLLLASASGLPWREGLDLTPRLVAADIALCVSAAWAAGTASIVHCVRHGVQGRIASALQFRHRDSPPSVRAQLGITLAAQTALALALLPQALLVSTNVVRLMRVDMGVTTEDVAAMRTRLPAAPYAGIASEQDFYRALMDGVADDPMYGAVALTNILPLTGEDERISVRDSAIPFGTGPILMAGLRIVNPEYFQVLGVRLQDGHTFVRTDDAAGDLVVVVSDTIARGLFGQASAVGRRITLAMREWRVIGVVEASRLSLASDPQLEVFLPAAQVHRAASMDGAMQKMWILVRGPADNRLSVIDRLSAQVRAIEPGAVVSEVGTMDRLVFESVGQRVFVAALVSSLAAIASLLAAFGSFATFSRSVSERRRELAIRFGLGSSSLLLVWEALRRSIAAASVGVVCGLLLGGYVRHVAFSHLASAGVDGSQSGLTVTVVSALVIGAATAIGAVVPARTVLKVDAVELLRD